MRRALAAVTMTGAALLGLSLEAQAQSLVMPCGPLCVKAIVPEPHRQAVLEQLTNDYIYPGRTMGGGTRILRPIPPPSFLNRRED